MRVYLLSDRSGLYMAFGEDCVSAAKSLAARLGDDANTERFSVSGSWAAESGTCINAGKFWPYFTADPPQRYCDSPKLD